MFKKNIEDITYDDIKWLSDNKISESEILDYKHELIEDDKLVKHVCAFANTRGGHLIFGIKESGNGGHPTCISGIDSPKLNKERIEQIILSNIAPRVVTRIQIIKIPDSQKSILVIEIPDSYMKPHQISKRKTFPKRFQFESTEMTEQEVSDCYKLRFTNHEQIETYIQQIHVKQIDNSLGVNIIIIPSNIQHRLIDISNSKSFEWLKSIQINNLASFFCTAFEPFGYGIICKFPSDNYRHEQTSIHRNGCVHYFYQSTYTDKPDDFIYIFNYRDITNRLIQALEFSNGVLNHYNYFGDVKIILTIACVWHNRLSKINQFDSSHILKQINCRIEREYSLNDIKSNYEKITASIMNEIFNHYGIFSCPLFDKNGKYLIK